MTAVILVVGLWLFGTGEALLVDGDLGVSPWTVLAQGIGKHLGIGIGWATFLISALVLLLWIPLREKPGLGTLSNAVVVALALGVTVPLLPTPDAARLAARRGDRGRGVDRCRQWPVPDDRARTRARATA